MACVGLEQEGAEKLRPSSRATPGGLTSERRLSFASSESPMWLAVADSWAWSMQLDPWKYCTAQVIR